MLKLFLQRIRFNLRNVFAKKITIPSRIYNFEFLRDNLSFSNNFHVAKTYKNVKTGWLAFPLILQNQLADKNIIENTGLLRLATDLSTFGNREPINQKAWLQRYLTQPSSVREEIPHPSVNFLTDQDLDYLITYLLSLGSTDE